MNIEVIPAAQAPEALVNWSNRTSPEWDQVANRLLDSKRTDWLRIRLGDVPGKAGKGKQRNLTSAMEARKLTVRTRVLGDHLWFQVCEPKKPKVLRAETK